MPLNLIITGVGGQGNVLASQIVGRAAVNKGFKVTIGETFGLSQRGGPVMSHIRLSRESDYGPIIPPNMAHLIVSLEPLEAIRILEEFGNSKTQFLVNSRPVYPLNVIAGDVAYPDQEWIKSVISQFSGALFWVEATKHALDLGGPIMLNMIMLGALCTLDEFPFTTDDIKSVIKDVFPESKLSVNLKALDVGERLMDT
ncbi:MAG: indolepyruvate oxidoreductase subunit beta [Desulfobacterales bacterium]|nr:indolepyruvate oxidoreductase subunit beta [Desulfobacterales bacterium]